jgi:hypothetical protein
VVVGAIVVVVVGAIVVVVGAIVVVVGAIVVVVVGAIVVVVGAIVVVVGAIVVVVGGVTTPTTQVMPDGRSVGSAEKVSCAFQYLSSCVADATPKVHAYPMLYRPGGMICGPLAPNTPNEMVGNPVSNPGPPAVLATAVVLLITGVLALNSG